MKLPIFLFFLPFLYPLFHIEGHKDLPVPSSRIEQQLDLLEHNIKAANKIFQPWYTGPLLAPSAHVVPPGKINLQPYLFITRSNAKFDEHGHVQKAASISGMEFPIYFQTGLFKSVDIILASRGIQNRKGKVSSVEWGDSSISLGLGILKESLTSPALKFFVKQLFPTGRYQNLNPDKKNTDISGIGAYLTSISLCIAKTNWWFAANPMAIRFYGSWELPSSVSVTGYNVYGGNQDTKGKVQLRNRFSLDVGLEYSLSQPWVIALDLTYFYANPSKFTGNPGTDNLGNPNVVGTPFMDQITIAPALEWNLSENFGFIGGAWLALWGRNTRKFKSTVISFSWTF